MRRVSHHEAPGGAASSFETRARNAAKFTLRKFACVRAPQDEAEQTQRQSCDLMSENDPVTMRYSP